MSTSGVSRQKKSGPATDLFDRAEVLSRVDGDIELISSLVDIFLAEAGPMMEAIRAAVTSGDAGKIEKTAHRLKGSVSIFGAQTVSKAAFELEKVGRAADLTQVNEILGRLEQQIAKLQPALREFLRELQTSS